MLEKGIFLKPHNGEGEARVALAETYPQAGNRKIAIAKYRVVEQMPPEYPVYEKPLNNVKELLKKYA